nr:MAG TPA: hypothetical protein [Caudoviricetes sp.]
MTFLVFYVIITTIEVEVISQLLSTLKCPVAVTAGFLFIKTKTIIVK